MFFFARTALSAWSAARARLIKIQRLDELAAGFPAIGTEPRSAAGRQLRTDDVCPICLDPLDTRARRIPCGHVLHLGCLRASIMVSSTCPTCRSAVLAPPVLSPVSAQQQQHQQQQQQQQQQPSTQPSGQHQQRSTQPSTHPSTQPFTQPVTQPVVTQPLTQPSTQPLTQASTQASGVSSSLQAAAVPGNFNSAAAAPAPAVDDNSAPAAPAGMETCPAAQPSDGGSSAGDSTTDAVTAAETMSRPAAASDHVAAPNGETMMMPHVPRLRDPSPAQQQQHIDQPPSMRRRRLAPDQAAGQRSPSPDPPTPTLSTPRPTLANFRLAIDTSQWSPLSPLSFNIIASRHRPSPARTPDQHLSDSDSDVVDIIGGGVRDLPH
jgi:hypothetical protein